MEYIEGITLKNYLGNYEYYLAIDEVLAMIIELLEKIGKIHSMGYVHLDIKLDNIIISKKTNNLFVIDFGNSQKISGRLEDFVINETVCNPPEIDTYITRYTPKDK